MTDQDDIEDRFDWAYAMIEDLLPAEDAQVVKSLLEIADSASTDLRQLLAATSALVGAAARYRATLARVRLLCSDSAADEVGAAGVALDEAGEAATKTMAELARKETDQ